VVWGKPAFFAPFRVTKRGCYPEAGSSTKDLGVVFSGKASPDPSLTLRTTIKLRYFFAQDGVENLGFRFDW